MVSVRAEGESRRRSYDARTLRTCVLMTSSGKKRIHVPSLKRQILRSSKDRDDNLGPQWRYWTDRSLKKLEDNGILSSCGNSSVELTQKAKSIVSSAAHYHHLTIDDPRIFQDTDDTVWQSAARRAARNGQPTKRRTPKDVDIDSLQSKPVDKMTKPELLSLMKSMSEKIYSLERSLDDAADTSLDNLDEVEDYKRRLRDKSEELESVQGELLELQRRRDDLREAHVVQQLDYVRSVNATDTLTRLPSGALINAISGQPTPESSEVDPGSPRVQDTANMGQLDVFDTGAQIEYGGDEGANQLFPTPTLGYPWGSINSESVSLEGIRKDRDRFKARVEELEADLEKARELAMVNAERAQAQLAEQDEHISSISSELVSVQFTLSTTQSALSSLQDTHSQLLQAHSEATMRLDRAHEDLAKERSRTHELERIVLSTSSSFQRTEAALVNARELADGWERKAQSLLDRVERNRVIANERLATAMKDESALTTERDAATKKVEMLVGQVTEKERAVRAALEEKDRISDRVAKLSRRVGLLNKEGKGLREEVSTLKLSLEEKSRELGLMVSEKAESMKEKETLETRVSTYLTEKAVLEQAVAETQKQKEEALEAVSALRKLFEEKQSEQANLSRQLEEERSQNAVLLGRITTLETKVRSETKTKNELAIQLSSVEAAKASLEGELKNGLSSIASLSVLLEKMRASEQDFRQTLDKLKEESTLAARNHKLVIEGLKQDLKVSTSALEQKTSELVALQSAFDAKEKELANRLAEAEERADALDDEAEELREAALKEREAVEKMREVYRRMKRKQEEELRQMDLTISSLNVTTVPSRKRKRSSEVGSVRDSGIGL